ncbi:lysophospholipase L1-like esterase [Ancylobacter aquaticus]|uniref:Lysophospholipase L1-like esterase n=1 Tax=Ancylobacter aquaticus TaxID=100 RepID=A0A4R1HZB7_ANCAQ|nr:GDSL-type esterase/lipase family protein [Ancylobacter aquaticus]TCK28184.1 lysophospholipase L1-like esterase [Ancylobacter aquaticus]
MRARLAVALACAFVAGAASGAIAYRAGLHRYLAPSSAASVTPTNERYAHRTSLFREFPAEAGIVMVGDSLTEMGDWQSIFPGASIANRGIGYDTTAGALARVDTVTSTGAAKAFLMLGTNDFMMGSDVEATFARYSALIEKMRPSMQIYVQSTLYVGGGWRSERNPLIADLNARLRAKCEAGACTFVDLNASIAPDGVLPARCSIDGVHLNGACYRLWADAIRPYITSPARP